MNFFREMCGIGGEHRRKGNHYDNAPPLEAWQGVGSNRAGDRTRTGDVQLGKLAFYQLNYARNTLKVTGCRRSGTSDGHRQVSGSS